MHELRVEIYRVPDGAKVGIFYIPAAADDKWLAKNLPPLFHGIRVIATSFPFLQYGEVMQAVQTMLDEVKDAQVSPEAAISER